MESKRQTASSAGRHTARQTALRLRNALRYYYQCFLLHFVLGLTVAAVLFCAVFHLQTGLSDGTLLAQMRHSVFDLRPDNTAQRLSSVILQTALYCEPGAFDAYFPDTTEGASALYIPIISHHDSNEPLTLFDGDGDITVSDALEPSVPLKERIRDSIPRETLYAYDASQLPDNMLAVLPMDLSSQDQFTAQNGGILFSNQTAYLPDAASLLNTAYPIDAASVPASAVPDGAEIDDTAAPLVLILHTHGTEAYAPDGAAALEASYNFRSEDKTKNIVSVGRTLASVLSDAGIPVLHCETMFDADSYSDSYVKAAAYIRETLAAYPSIQYVFDVHRDALTAADGSVIRPVTTINGEVCAQVMCVVGTDEAGAYHPGWRDNLTIAAHLQKRLNDVYTAFTRPINLRSATFNAQYAPGSLLLEIGAAGNSVEEACSAAYYLGQVLAEMILSPED